MVDIIAPRRGEFFTPDGIPTQRFITWIEGLTLQGNENTTEIVNTNTREAYPWPISLTASEIDAAYNFDLLESQPQLRAVTIAASYTASDFDFINATQNSTITFPEFPKVNSVLIVRNGDGSKINLSGNGRNINGSLTGTLRRESTAIEFYYFIDTNEWFAK